MCELWLGGFAVQPAYSIDAQSGKKGWFTQYECIGGGGGNNFVTRNNQAVCLTSSFYCQLNHPMFCLIGTVSCGSEKV